MGCSGSREFSVYNERLNKTNNNTQRESGPFCNSKFGDYANFQKKNPDVTIISLIKDSFERHGNLKCMGYRQAFINDKKEVDFKPDFTTVTYRDVWTQASTLAKAIEKLNLCPVNVYDKEEHYDEEAGKFKMMGIFARNCVEWICTDLACQLSSTTSATFYSTLGDEAFEHVFNQTRLETICITPENIKTIIKYHEKYRFRSLKNIILFDTTLHNTEEDKKLLQDKMKDFNVNVFFYSKLVSMKGSELEGANPVMSNADTLFTLCYTSGTTSLPKGVKLTQRNFGSQTNVLEDVDFGFTSDDVHYSYLPLAHVMERCVILFTLVYGCSSYFISGEPKKYLAAELALCRPTFLVAVPRVLSLFRTIILDGMAKLTGMKKSLADRALATKEANFDSSGALTHWFYDSFVLNKVRERFGGRIRVFIVGSAPLPAELAKSIKILFSVPIVEAYGMTETTGGLVGSSYLDTRNLSCGGCLRSCAFKLVDVPEMNYHSLTTDTEGNYSPTGEICAKGMNITSGYFRDKKNTLSTIDDDGWLHTGDVGRIVFADQGLKIIDRVKEIFKLAQGEYIAPSKLEGAYALSPYVEQILIHGDSHHTFIVAIIFPSRLKLKLFLVEKGILKDSDQLEAVDAHFNSTTVQDELRASFNKIAKEKNFNSLEKITKMIIHNEMFTQQNGLLTDTMKMKRKSFSTMFEKQINEAYSGSS